MTGNIIGEEFQPYVAKQIKRRQAKHGKGLFFNDSGKFDNRNEADLNFLHNKNTWIKIASSVKIEEKFDLLKNLGLPNSDGYKGIELTKKAILFNTISQLNIENITDENNNIVQKTNYTFRSGIAKSNELWNPSAYGFGGTDFGLQPIPGITSVNINTLNRGSIRKATVEIKAYNKFQFNLIELLYLRLGFTMMLEWGWDKYASEEEEYKQVGNTLIEDFWFSSESDGSTQLKVLEKIEAYRNKYEGNYDGFFGKVCNYNWEFKSDGSYSIILELITLGDVIESLQIRIPTSQIFLSLDEKKLEEIKQKNPIMSSLGSTSLDKWLYEAATHSGNFKPNSDYLVIKNSNSDSNSGTNNPLYNDIKKTETDFIHYMYFVTFRELILKITELCIPRIINGGVEHPQIIFDTSIEKTLIKVFPNQISIDPRVCVFEPNLSPVDFSEEYSNMGNLKPYIVSIDGIAVGQLMNLYINFDFILQCLHNNLDKENKLSIFKFLDSLCVGINNAMGGVNKIQPIIKEDLTITFIDQALQSSPAIKKRFSPQNISDTAFINVYGYNKSSKSSNFVHDISFKTKLSKETSAMISIGATAGGNETSIKNGDATAFSKWNKGLIDRFSEHIQDPSILTNLDKFNQSFENSYGASQMKYQVTSRNGVSVYTVSYLQQNYKPLIEKYYITNWYNKIDYDKISFWVNYYIDNYPSLMEFNSSNPTIEQKAAYDIAAVELNPNLKPVSGAEAVEKYSETDSTAFLIYIIEAFGGTLSTSELNSPITYTRSASSAKYFWFNSTFINKGIDLYKPYLASKHRQLFTETGEASPQIGFLPLEFDLKLDGISGMKIYNKLNISQDFLPNNYPKSFDFIITKLNHKIESNSWTTEIGTISTSNIDESYSVQSKDDVPYMKKQTVSQKEVPINDNILKTAKILKYKKINKVQAAAIMGNISVETGNSFDPFQKQIGGFAMGLIQWEPKWYSYDGSWEGVLKRVGNNIQSQIDFLFKGSPDINGRLKDMKGWLLLTKDYNDVSGLNLSNAVRWFEEKIEQAGKPNMGQRIARALYFYNQFRTGGKLDWDKL